MNAADVKSLVEQEIAGRWDETNDHGVDLGTSLLSPTIIHLIFRRVLDGKIDDHIIRAWLVLEEDPRTRDGYKIVFDENRMTFGLACSGFAEDQHLVLIGFYGDFWTTFHAM